MKLKNILNESQHLSYKRMNVGEDEDKGMTNEEKRAFLEAVSSYRQLGEMISHRGDLREIHENIKNIVENANSITLKETGDWFDKVTVNRHMKSMNESYKIFSNSIKEIVTLQQRMESAYDEIGEVLGKYYEIKEGNAFGAAVVAAKEKGEDEFEVGGKTYKVESVNEEIKVGSSVVVNYPTLKKPVMGKVKHILKSPTGLVYVLDGDKGVWDAKNVSVKESVNESMRLSDLVNEAKYTIIDPKGNSVGTGEKDQVTKRQKKLGGSKKGYFVVPANKSLVARRTLEKFKFDIKNPKLQDKMSDLYFESVIESMNEGYSTEEKRIVLMAVRKIMKYKNVDMKTAMNYVLGAGNELEQEIEKGKVK